jgi:hypothetical protein
LPHIIQIFKSVVRIKKPDYTSAFHQWAECWEDNILSRSGFVSGSILYLPITEKPNIEATNTELIIIEDIRVLPPSFLKNKEDLAAPMPENRSAGSTSDLIADHAYCFGKKPFRIIPFGIFKLEKNQENNFTLHLGYSENKFNIGVPGRDNHQIAELKPHQPIRYRINGKSDFTLSGRKQRTFNEFDYFIEYLGRVESIGFAEPESLEKAKTIPLINCKIIDERKILK